MGRKIFINPGHMPGVDSGACGNGLQEADVALRIGNSVAGYLEAVGYEVKVLQSDNLSGESPDYPNITATANEWGADLFISIHCNAATSTARGTETLVYSLGGDSEKLGKCINTQIVNTMQAIDADFPDRGVKKDVRGLAVLRLTDMPAVLTETAFIDNEEDAKLLVEQEDNFAKCIARGISDFYAA